MTKTRDYAAITSLDEARTLADKLLRDWEQDGKIIGFDVETGYSGDPFWKRSLDVLCDAQFVVGFSITNSPSWARYLPLRHDGAEGNLPPMEVWEIFRPVLEKVPMVCHQKKFEDKNLRMLARKGDAKAPIVTPIGEDTMLKAYVLARWQEAGLKFLSKELLGVEQVTLVALIEKVLERKMTKAEADALRFNMLPIVPEVIDYACDDAALCLELNDLLGGWLEEEPHRHQIMKLEDRIGNLMVDMELHGVATDWDGIFKSHQLYAPFRNNYDAVVRAEFQRQAPDVDLTKTKFNSPKQMQELLYDKLGLPVTKYSQKSGKPSTDKIALERLRRENSAVDMLLQLREIDNLGARHSKWLNENSHAWDKRVHASYNQVIVPTGRFSADNPAIQQLPKKWFWSIDPEFDPKSPIPEGWENGNQYWAGNYRNFIMAAPGHYLLTYDVSQGELRVLAGVSEEKRLLEAFENGEDVHTLTAAMMLSKEANAITDDERQIGKALPLWEVVWTPYGESYMGALDVGSEVSTPDGVAVVTKIFDQGVRPVFRVRFSDDSEVTADGEHLWQTMEGLKTTNDLTPGDSIPTASWEPRFSEAFEADPYLLGALVAAGQFRMTDLRISLPNEDVLKLAKLPEGLTYRKVRNHAGKEVFSISSGQKNYPNSGGYVNPLENTLRTLGLRQSRYTRGSRGVKTEERFIPWRIIHNTSLEARLSFLQGMLDARGTRSHTRGAEFPTYSYKLAKDLQKLVWSLGGRARISQAPSPWGTRIKRMKETYYVHIALEECPFRLPEKAIGWTSDLPVLRTVASITPDGEEECRCISLNTPDGLFLAGSGYTVTHNTMNFALLYQMGVKSLSDRLGISLSRAEELYANYFKQFSNVTTWIERTQRDARFNGYVETFYGRKIPVWGIDSPRRVIQAQALRSAVNYPIQGGLADIVKVSMVRAERLLREAGLWGNGVMLIMNQHDSLSFEVRNDLHPTTVRKILHEAVTFKVREGFPTFVADWELGQRWGSSSKWKDEDVAQDEAGEWYVVGAQKPSTGAQKDEDDSEDVPAIYEPVEAVLTAPPTLHIILEKVPPKDRAIEFLRFAKARPGDTITVLKMPGSEQELPFKTDLTVDDAPRISLALDGAIVRVPENSSMLMGALLAADLEAEDGN